MFKEVIHRAGLHLHQDERYSDQHPCAQELKEMRPRESSGGERGKEEMSNGMQMSKTGVCEEYSYAFASIR